MLNNVPFTYFSGFRFFNSKPYAKNGIAVHKAPFGDNSNYYLTAEFTDTKTGKATDYFYGAQNDFNLCFLAKAARGERFNVIFHDYCDAPKLHIPYNVNGERIGYVGTKIGTLKQNDDGSWSLVKYELLEKVNGHYHLYNIELREAIRKCEISKTEDAYIAESLAFGEDTVWADWDAA